MEALERMQRAYTIASSCLLAILLGGVVHGCGPALVREGKVAGGGREDFGRNRLATWYPLTEYEEAVLGRTDEAGRGEARALLELALLASGDVRTKQQAAPLIRKVEDFVTGVEQELSLVSNIELRAKTLHRLMHEELLDSSDSKLAGYDLAQTSLSELLRSGEYNCVSSALLYVILCRYFGIDARGVLLPSHVFAEVRLPKGKTLDVETTTPSGFNLRHDPQFYREQAEKWSRKRGLAPSTHEQYLRRQVVDPLHLVAHTLNCQHTHKGQMNAEDRNRLMEMMVLLTPEVRSAAFNLLVLYSWEYHYMSVRKDFQSAQRMFKMSARWIWKMARKWHNDREMANLATGNLFSYARVLGEVTLWERSFQWLDTALALGDPGHEDHRTHLANSMVLVGRRIEVLVENEHAFVAAEVLQKRYFEICEQVDRCPERRTWLYSRWSSHYWANRQWRNVVEVLGKEFSVALGADKVRVLSNISGAYHNWASETEKKEDLSGAVAILAQCARRFPTAPDCDKTLARLRHRLLSE
jgi:hypothetical protein